MDLKKEELLDRIVKCGEWMMKNQITDRLDANRGRGISCFDQQTGFLYLTESWRTGLLCMCLLALYKRTENAKYVIAAEYAGRYILALQTLDKKDDRYYGVIREVTPQSIEFAPRDAVTAAWALIWLFKATKNPLYLERAVLFGQWHMTHGMYNGWPLYACYMDRNLDDFYRQGAFQSGTGLFYYDLFMATGDSVFIDKGFKPIAENYRDNFFYEDGSIILSRDPFSGKVISANTEKMRQMHSYNDDFGAAMLQTAAEFFDDETFRLSAYKYTKWLRKEQDDSGDFAGGKYPSGIPIALMYFHDLGNFYNDQDLLKGCDNALKKLLSMQIFDSENCRLDGGFQGMYENPKEECFETRVNSFCVNMRVSAYALIALLKLESEIEDIWLGRYNKKFVDPLTRGAHNLIW